MNNDDMKYILTIDMGTTAFKAAVFDCEGREAGSATEEYQIQTPRPGWAEMDAEKYTELFKAAVSRSCKECRYIPGGHTDSGDILPGRDKCFPRQ